MTNGYGAMRGYASHAWSRRTAGESQRISARYS